MCQGSSGVDCVSDQNSKSEITRAIPLETNKYMYLMPSMCYSWKNQCLLDRDIVVYFYQPFWCQFIICFTGKSTKCLIVFIYQRSNIMTLLSKTEFGMYCFDSLENCVVFSLCTESSSSASVSIWINQSLFFSEIFNVGQVRICTGQCFSVIAGNNANCLWHSNILTRRFHNTNIYSNKN